MKDGIDILSSIHPNLRSLCIDLGCEAGETDSYGSINSYVAVANFFVQLYNEEHPDHQMTIISLRD